MISVRLSQNTQLLEDFFSRTELLALVGVDFLDLVGQNRDRGKTKLVAVEQLLHLLIGNSFLMDYVGNVVCLPEIYDKCSNILFASVKAGSEIMKNSLLSGGERRKRSMAALRWILLMNFCKLKCHLSSQQTYKATSKNSQFFF